MLTSAHVGHNCNAHMGHIYKWMGFLWMVCLVTGDPSLDDTIQWSVHETRQRNPNPKKQISVVQDPFNESTITMETKTLAGDIMTALKTEHRQAAELTKYLEEAVLAGDRELEESTFTAEEFTKLDLSQYVQDFIFQDS